MVPVVLETERLRLREVDSGDAPFIFELLNDRAWLRFIGDKNIRSLDDARAYIANGPQKMYAERGFGLWLVEPKAGGAPMGLCGLIKRDTLADIDLGFAFLPPFRGGGNGCEAATAALAYARDVVRAKRIVAITSLDNESSMKLLRRVGFALEGVIRLTDGGEEINLFAREL